MKKWQIAGIIVVVLVVLVLAFVVDNKGTNSGSTSNELSEDVDTIINNAQQESQAVIDTERKESIQIDINTYLEYKAASEARIILLARPTCGYCQIAEPIIENIAYEYNLDINYLNTDNFTDETQTAFVQSDDAFKEGFGTPYLFIVKDGSIVDAVDGLTDRAHYVQFFTDNGFIG